MNDQYIRNIPAISKESQLLLNKKKVLVVGCGGLGGYIIENLLRIGVGEITAVDGDVFQPSNLNRQLLSTQPKLGYPKAQAAFDRAKEINPEVTFHARNLFLTEENADHLVCGQDLVIDALDNIHSRLILENACAKADIPLIHGAICGWQAQICTVMPGSNLLHMLYENCPESTDKSALVFAPALCAAVQSAEAVKLLCGRSGDLVGKLCVIDLQYMDWNIITLR